MSLGKNTCLYTKKEFWLFVVLDKKPIVSIEEKPKICAIQILIKYLLIPV